MDGGKENTSAKEGHDMRASLRVLISDWVMDIQFRQMIWHMRSLTIMRKN